jgi:hypothetical protein
MFILDMAEIRPPLGKYKYDTLTIPCACGDPYETSTNLSLANDRVGQSHYSQEKEIPDYIHSTPADRFVGPHLVSLPLSTKVVEKPKHLSILARRGQTIGP